MIQKALIGLACIALPVMVSAETISFEAADFGLNPTFSNVVTFQFEIETSVLLRPGRSYANPALISVDYSVSGTLAGTPSGFPAFALVRSIGGDEFYAQGSSLSFEIAAGADLSDGLQVSDLAGTGTVFEFNGREVGTGRYHPALFQLNADGTGTIQNSNNFGGINPASQEVVDVDFGDEYVTGLTFDPATLSLTGPIDVPILEDGFESAQVE